MFTSRSSGRPLERALHRATALVLSALLLVSPVARPCGIPCFPGTVKNIVVVPGSVNLLAPDMAKVTIRVLGYKIVGGNGAFCSCALDLPLAGKILDVCSVSMVFAGSNMPVPGFQDWATNAVSAADWQAALNSGTWKSFVTPATAALPAGTLVNFGFSVLVKVTPDILGNGLSGTLASAGSMAGPSGSAAGVTGGTPGSPSASLDLPSPDVMAQVMANLQETLSQSVIGTDEATASGALTGHIQHIEGLGSVTMGPDVESFVDLGQALAGTNGEVILAGAGNLTGGESASLVITNALANSQLVIFAGFTTINVPFKGGVLVPSPDLCLLLPSGTGTFALPFIVPTGIPAGAPFFMQAAVADSGAVQGVALSNALMGTFQ